ncbi:MAG TPA: ABC transporter permease, partial [Polyangiaceae bacterium]|nr:ABC transporter permease [Polyangiaceae bacterium]
MQSAVAPRASTVERAPDEAALSVPPARFAPGSVSRRLRSVAIGALSIGLWLALWQLASVHKWNFFFRFENIPAPTEVAAAFSELYAAPKFAAHVGNSVRRIFLGFSLAAGLSVVLGLLIGRFRVAAQSLFPPLEVLRPIPAVAWIPIAILLFASAEQSMVFITFIG